jgi:hypothetical protein
VTTVYAPGTLESDPKKQNQALQDHAKKIATSIDDIAALTAVVATKGTVTSVASGIGLTGGPITGSGTLAVSLSSLTSSLGADVTLNNTANYFDGPSVAQGTTGTWFVSGTIAVLDTAGGAGMLAKLWDGTTVICSSNVNTTSANLLLQIHLSGVITSPAGNLRISCRDLSSTNGLIKFNASGNSKDSTISAVRIA